MTAPIVVEQDFATDRDRLWRAITAQSEMVRWYFEEIPEFRPDEGFSVDFVVTAEGRDFVHCWTVLDVVTRERIEHTWRYEGIEGDGRVLWLLSDSGAGAHLRLECHGIDTFPNDDPMFTREACEAGWRYFINERLKEYLDG